MVRPGRFERPTSSSAGKRSIQLSYGRKSRIQNFTNDEEKFVIRLICNSSLYLEKLAENIRSMLIVQV